MERSRTSKPPKPPRRVADHVVSALYNAGATTVFGVTGGMIMHLTDAVLQHGRMRFVACHHETAAVMAADAWGRYTGRIGAVFVTAGPGALNSLTGVAGAYCDSAPVVVVAGQSVSSQAVASMAPNAPRQFALQGFATLPIFKKVTKWAVMLEASDESLGQIEQAIWLARDGRPGPVWLEIPVDVQGGEMPEIESFSPYSVSPASTPEQISHVTELLKRFHRPVVLAGAGIRAAGADVVLTRFIQRHRLPIMTSRLGMDLVSHYSPFFIGRPGTYGDRPANFAIQNADLIVAIGCRLGLGLVGYGFKDWGKNAVKVMVDVDERELSKPAVVPNISICADAGKFLDKVSIALGSWRFRHPSWPKKIKEWREKYPTDLPEYARETDGVNSYHFVRIFSEQMPPDADFVVDTGSCFHVHAQAFEVKLGQRHIITGGLSTMGFMPASIGAAFAVEGKTPRRTTYCITGDGSLQMHLQELATISHHRLPVKIVVFNNHGYLLIRNTQKNFQDGRLIGEGPDTGLSFPSLKGLARVYGFAYVKIREANEIVSRVGDLQRTKGPAILEVMMPSEQALAPRVAARKFPDGTMAPGSYDDMAPFLPRAEYERESNWWRSGG